MGRSAGEHEAAILEEEERRASAPLPVRLETITRALAWARAAGDAAWTARALYSRGWVLRLAGRLEDAARDLDEAYGFAHARESAAFIAAVATEMGSVASLRGDLEAARARLLEALALAEDDAPPPGALGNLGMVEAELGLLGAAERRYREALAAARRHEASDASRGTTMMNLANVRMEQGALDEAEALLKGALELHSGCGDRLFEGICIGNLGNLRFLEGALDEGEGCFRSALALHEALGFAQGEGHYGAGLGATLARQGRLDEAADAFVRSKRRLEEASAPALLLTHELQEGFLDLARGEAALARVRLRAAEREPRLGMAARMVAKLLAAELNAPFEPRAWDPGPRRLRVARDGSRFELGRARADLTRRRVPRALLVALVEGRLHRAGQALPLSELVAAGWPGERIRPDAAANRLYVALSTLRKLGLGPVLYTRNDGYLLDPETEIELL